MSLDLKVAEALNRIDGALSMFRDPVVLWSGGKDSTVMLHLIRTVARECPPCVCFQEPWQRDRLAYTQVMAEKWNLTLYDFPPSELALNRGRGRIDIMQRFQLGSLPLWLARGTEPPMVGEPWRCGLEWLQRPKGCMDWPWDVAFCGHKSIDVDPCSGPVPLEIGAMLNPGGTTLIYPLENWTDEDIFAYADAHGVMLDPVRYGVGADPEKRGNPDYYRACTACLNPEQGPWVDCPKLKCKVPNVAGRANWMDAEMPYCNWRANGEQ
jgi:hypothetical protein